MKYQNLPLEESYRLLNSGGVVLVSTISKSGIYNIAPVAWNMPIKKDPARSLIGLGMRHQTFENIQQQKRFILSIPHISQVDLIRKTGTISGYEVDKFKQFEIEGFKGKKVDALIPKGVIGYIECILYKQFEVDGLAMIVGEACSSTVHTEAYDQRLLSEKEVGKTVHHLGGKHFITLKDHLEQLS